MDLRADRHLQENRWWEGEILRPIRGIGLGLRSAHYAELVQAADVVPWLEVLSDNYLGAGGPPQHWLRRLSEIYPTVLHGVGMSLGATQPPDPAYLDRLNQLQKITQAAWVSDHLCFSHLAQHYSHDLLPLPYTEEAVAVCVQNIQRVQDHLSVPLLIENVSSYLSYSHSQLTEWEFLNAVAQQADCGILLDINNIAVSAYNHGFSAERYLQGIDPARVRQMHLAGYEQAEDHRLDTHGSRVSEEVWALYQSALQRFGPLPCNIEWDADIPALGVLLKERQRAQGYFDALG